MFLIWLSEKHRYKLRNSKNTPLEQPSTSASIQILNTMTTQTEDLDGDYIDVDDNMEEKFVQLKECLGNSQCLDEEGETDTDTGLSDLDSDGDAD